MRQVNVEHVAIIKPELLERCIVQVFLVDHFAEHVRVNKLIDFGCGYVDVPVAADVLFQGQELHTDCVDVDK